MNHYKFKSDSLNTHLEKITLGNKPSIIILGLNLNLNKEVNQFLENFFSNNFIPQKVITTRITGKSVIPTNSYEHNFYYVSDNITTYISYHLPQFLIIENLKQSLCKQNPTISSRGYKNSNKEAFKTELNKLDWSFVTKNNDINLGFETFLLSLSEY